MLYVYGFLLRVLHQKFCYFYLQIYLLLKIMFCKPHFEGDTIDPTLFLNTEVLSLPGQPPKFLLSFQFWTQVFGKDLVLLPCDHSFSILHCCFQTFLHVRFRLSLIRHSLTPPASLVSFYSLSTLHYYSLSLSVSTLYAWEFTFFTSLSTTFLMQADLLS